jgi:L-fuconolactonase
VTGWVSLDRPESVDLLGQLAQDRHLRVVRPMLHDLPDPLWATRPQVRRGLRRVAELGLRFEVLSYANHLPAAYAAPATIPELPAVINHLSKPVFCWDDDEEWRTWMARHAERPSTWCKLSGMLTEVGPGWTDAHLQPPRR